MKLVKGKQYKHARLGVIGNYTHSDELSYNHFFKKGFKKTELNTHDLQLVTPVDTSKTQEEIKLDIDVHVVKVKIQALVSEYNRGADKLEEMRLGRKGYLHPDTDEVPRLIIVKKS